MSSRIQHWHRASPTKVMSGRIEKARSTHASPAYTGRKRAWTETVESLLPHASSASALSFDELSCLLPMPQQYQTTYQSRPTSWHPSTHPYTQTQPRFSQSMNVIPYQVTPKSHQVEQSTLSVAPAQLPHMNQLFDSPPELYMSNGPSSTSPASTVYSADCGSNPSPSFQLTNYNNQSPAVLDSTPMTVYSGDYKMNSNQYSQYVERFEKQPEIYSESNQVDSVIQTQVDPDLEALESSEEDDGEVLVALGLYDAPQVSRISLFSSGKSLMLAEAWQPTEETDDAEDDEEENEDDSDDASAEKIDGDAPEQSIKSTETLTNDVPSLARSEDPTTKVHGYDQIQEWSQPQINQTVASTAQSWYETYPRQQLQHSHQPVIPHHQHQGPGFEGRAWTLHH
jgi:hypothetical protein